MYTAFTIITTNMAVECHPDVHLSKIQHRFVFGTF